MPWFWILPVAAEDAEVLPLPKCHVRRLPGKMQLSDDGFRQSAVPKIYLQYVPADPEWQIRWWQQEPIMPGFEIYSCSGKHKPLRAGLPGLWHPSR